MTRQQLGSVEVTADIDTAILACSEKNWRKVALVIAVVHEQLASAATHEQIAERVKLLVDAGRLRSQGDLSNWRHSEVRLAG